MCIGHKYSSFHQKKERKKNSKAKVTFCNADADVNAEISKMACSKSHEFLSNNWTVIHVHIRDDFIYFQPTSLARFSSALK